MNPHPDFTNYSLANDQVKALQVSCSNSIRLSRHLSFFKDFAAAPSRALRKEAHTFRRRNEIRRALLGRACDKFEKVTIGQSLSFLI